MPKTLIYVKNILLYVHRDRLRQFLDIFSQKPGIYSVRKFNYALHYLRLALANKPK